MGRAGELGVRGAMTVYKNVLEPTSLQMIKCTDAGESAIIAARAATRVFAVYASPAVVLEVGKYLDIQSVPNETAMSLLLAYVAILGYATLDAFAAIVIAEFKVTSGKI